MSNFNSANLTCKQYRKQLSRQGSNCTNCHNKPTTSNDIAIPGSWCSNYSHKVKLYKQPRATKIVVKPRLHRQQKRG